MNNNNIKTIENPYLHIDPTFYTELPDEDKPMTPEEESKLMKNIDKEEIDRVIEFYETQLDNPNVWFSWNEAKKILRRYD